MTDTFDCIVVGAGCFGAWTALTLVERGLRVAIVEAQQPGHSRSSSGGETRIIRMGYGPNEIYTKWSERSLVRWKDLFTRVGQPLFHQTGVLWLAEAGNEYQAATRSAFERLGVRHRVLSGDDMGREYPQIQLDAGSGAALLETESGVLMARRAVAAVVEAAVGRGVEHRQAVVPPPEFDAGTCRIDDVRIAGGDPLRVASDGFVVFACGPWLPKIFPNLLAQRMFISRQEVFFFGTPAAHRDYSAPALPAWIDLAQGAYGMPNLEGRGLKAGIDRHGPSFDPDSGSRLPTSEAIEDARQYVTRRFPALRDAPVTESRVCQYENTSQGDFIIDRHPDVENLWIAGGGSGHGFKHGPAVAEYLAARVLDGAPAEPRFGFESKLEVQRRAIY